MLIEMNGSISGFNLRQFASDTGNDLRFLTPPEKNTLMRSRLSTWLPIVWLPG